MGKILIEMTMKIVMQIVLLPRKEMGPIDFIVNDI